MQRQGERLRQEMEATRARMEAGSRARKGLRDDLRRALEQLRREMLAQQGKFSARELQELRDFLAKMKERAADLQRRQDELLKSTEQGADLEAVRRKQKDLDKEMEELLARTRTLLEARRRRAGERRPEFPDSPYARDRDEVKEPPREPDSDEPLPGKKDAAGKAGSRKDDRKAGKKEGDDEKEPLYMPALGGPRVKADPRFDKKRRPLRRDPQKGDKADPDEQRDELEDRQREGGRELDEARQSMESDRQTLEQMLRSLEEAMNAKPSRQSGQQPGESAEGDPAMEQLRQMLQSPQMRRAMAMAARMRQARQMGRGQPAGGSAAAQGNLQGGEAPGSREADLSGLDPRARAVILRLPPGRMRDELIQGMSEQGPEAYRAFIEDYFKRLTQDKKPGK
jgi:hypothetical protein